MAFLYPAPQSSLHVAPVAQDPSPVHGTIHLQPTVHLAHPIDPPRITAESAVSSHRLRAQRRHGFNHFHAARPAFVNPAQVLSNSTSGLGWEVTSRMMASAKPLPKVIHVEMARTT